MFGLRDCILISARSGKRSRAPEARNGLSHGITLCFGGSYRLVKELEGLLPICTNALDLTEQPIGDRDTFTVA
jgi:hypothetical protein